MATSQPGTAPDGAFVSIAPLLHKLLDPGDAPATALEIAAALALIFENKLSAVQCSSLLTLLRTTGRGTDADVVAACADSMRNAATPVDVESLKRTTRAIGRQQGDYEGGLCDIVGTGGDGHSLFNVSTAASIVASALLVVAKHGARAASSKSGSADVLQSIKPRGPIIENVSAETIGEIYEKGSYAFFFAPTFHKGMKNVAPIRKDLGFRTIFNILGPLANPVDHLIEASVYGVAQRNLGPVYAEALKLGHARKALVVCGEEDMDEISCAGRTYCWQIHETKKSEEKSKDAEEKEDAPEVAMTTFVLEPKDFGLETHPLSDVAPGNGPEENAVLLIKLLKNELPKDHPIVEFVLLNAAALLVISGLCDAETSSMGEGDSGEVIQERGPGNGRWKEGVRRARWAIESGQALKQLESYIDVTNKIAERGSS